MGRTVGDNVLQSAGAYCDPRHFEPGSDRTGSPRAATGREFRPRHRLASLKGRAEAPRPSGPSREQSCNWLSLRAVLAAESEQNLADSGRVTQITFSASNLTYPVGIKLLIRRHNEDHDNDQ